MLSEPLPRQDAEPIINFKREVRHILTGYGFQEVITYSLTSREMLEKMLPERRPLEPTPLRMANPMTADQEYLRTSLRANLLAALAANRRHEDGSIRFFELGRVYLPRASNLPYEPEMLCAILSGPRGDKSWYGEGEPLDFFDAKGAVEGLLAQLGVTGSFEPGKDMGLHPAKQAHVVIASRRLGVVGEVHPRVLANFEISENVYLFEINVTELLPATAGHRIFQPIPRFPATVRDIALIVDVETTHQEIETIIKSFPLVSQVAIFDVYTGGQVPPGKKSLAYRITYQSPTHTLTDEEVNRVQQQILSKLSREIGATLRS
jgi:phenylalanyl-tRNA synthetase beta chain